MHVQCTGKPGTNPTKIDTTRSMLGWLSTRHGLANGFFISCNIWYSVDVLGQWFRHVGIVAGTVPQANEQNSTGRDGFDAPEGKLL